MLYEQTVMRADGFRVIQFIETDAHGWLVDLWYELVDERISKGPFPTPKKQTSCQRPEKPTSAQHKVLD